MSKVKQDRLIELSRGIGKRKADAMGSTIVIGLVAGMGLS